MKALYKILKEFEIIPGVYGKQPTEEKWKVTT